MARGAIRWATSVPPVLREDGRTDTTAHHVLVVLATYASNDGTNARPALPTLADACYLTERAVVAALARLQSAGLIERTGEFNGCPVWRLRTHDVAPGDGSRRAERLERARHLAAERQRRHRARNAVGQRDVTPSDSVGNAVGQRLSRRATAFVTPPRPSQPQVSNGVSPLDLQLTSNDLSREATPRDDFDAFWAVYPRKVGKQSAAKAYAKAIKAGADPVTVLAGARRYAADRVGEDPTYTAHPTTWLNAGRWDDEPKQPRGPSGHQPYRSPDRISAYQSTAI